MLKYLVKVYFDSFEVPAMYLVGTFPYLMHWHLLCVTMPLVRPQGRARGQYPG